MHFFTKNIPFYFKILHWFNYLKNPGKWRSARKIRKIKSDSDHFLGAFWIVRLKKFPIFNFFDFSHFPGFSSFSRIFRIDVKFHNRREWNEQILFLKNILHRRHSRDSPQCHFEVGWNWVKSENLERFFLSRVQLKPKKRDMESFLGNYTDNLHTHERIFILKSKENWTEEWSKCYYNILNQSILFLARI